MTVTRSRWNAHREVEEWEELTADEQHAWERLALWKHDADRRDEAPTA
jgi:hypothetical protein